MENNSHKHISKFTVLPWHKILYNLLLTLKALNSLKCWIVVNGKYLEVWTALVVRTKIIVRKSNHFFQSCLDSQFSRDAVLICGWLVFAQYLLIVRVFSVISCAD